MVVTENDRIKILVATGYLLIFYLHNFTSASCHPSINPPSSSTFPPSSDAVKFAWRGAQTLETPDLVSGGRAVFDPAGMKNPKSTRKVLESYTIKATNTIVKAGDFVVMRAEEPRKPPYVAKVEKIETDNRNRVNVCVRWYYRPEESIGGRRQFHGSKEVFLSDHYDEQSADTIEGKCTIHSFKNYTKLQTVGAEDYFCRFEYKAATGGFTPDRVAVYCKCETPYNPDVLMAQCEACKDWFHPTCLNMTVEQVKKLDHFFCSDCAVEGGKKTHNSVKDSRHIEQKESERKKRRLHNGK